MSQPRRVTLVLGAGGPVGHAFHAGALAALADVVGWDARSACLVVGTSAGAQIAALLRAGLSGPELAARVTGAPLSGTAAAIARCFVRPIPNGERSSRSYAPASASYLRHALRRPRLARPGRLASALLPPGELSLEPQALGFRALYGDAWPAERTWVTAVELDSGEAVAFGRQGAPRVDVGTAVACSCAVPSIFAPVRVGARAYVDGGMASATHLDMLEGDSDAVIILSPLSMFSAMRLLLRRELRRLKDRGVDPLVLEPTGTALSAMGFNPMAISRMAGVARATRTTMARLLAKDAPALRDRLVGPTAR